MHLTMYEYFTSKYYKLLKNSNITLNISKYALKICKKEIY